MTDQAQDRSLTPLTFSVSETGVLVAGERHDVALYMDRLRETVGGWGQAVSVTDVADLAATAAAAGSVVASAGSFVQLSQRSMDLLAQNKMIPGRTAEFFQGAVRGQHGRFAGNLEFKVVKFAPSQAAALQLAAATAALRLAVENVEQAVAGVEGKVDELVARARAADVGPVVAHHAVLREMTAVLDQEGSLPRTDWDTVQHLGANVPGAIETIRRYVVTQIEVLDPSAPTQDRAKRLRRVVESGQIGLMLQLLVLAEDAYYLWQRLRLERVRVSDPDHLSSVTGRANAQLAQDLRRDTEMADQLTAALSEYGTQRPLERLRPLATRDLQDNVAILRGDLDRFADLRHIQIAEWSELSRPSVSDAVRELRDIASGTGQRAIDQARFVAAEVSDTATDVGQSVASQTSTLSQKARDRASSLRERLPTRGHDRPESAESTPDDQPSTPASAQSEE